MGFRVSIDGLGPVNLTEQCVKEWNFSLKFRQIPMRVRLTMVQH